MTMCSVVLFFFFIVTATTWLYTYLHTLSLHDALPIFRGAAPGLPGHPGCASGHRRRLRPRQLPDRHALPGRRSAGAVLMVAAVQTGVDRGQVLDRKSTRLNSSH